MGRQPAWRLAHNVGHQQHGDDGQQGGDGLVLHGAISCSVATATTGRDGEQGEQGKSCGPGDVHRDRPISDEESACSLHRDGNTGVGEQRRVVQLLVLDLGQLRHMSPNVRAASIKPASLRVGIEDSEVRRRIRAG